MARRLLERRFDQGEMDYAESLAYDAARRGEPWMLSRLAVLCLDETIITDPRLNWDYAKRLSDAAVSFGDAGALWRLAVRAETDDARISTWRTFLDFGEARSRHELETALRGVLPSHPTTEQVRGITLYGLDDAGQPAEAWELDFELPEVTPEYVALHAAELRNRGVDYL